MPLLSITIFSAGRMQNEVISKPVFSLVQKHSLEHSMPTMSSNIDRLLEVLLILRGQLADVGRLLCLYTPMPLRKAAPALLRWQDVVSAAMRVCWSRRGWSC